MFIKEILILLFILQFIQWAFKLKPTIAACGLWGFVGTEQADELKLKILSLYNESRGEDATGVCISNVVFKDTVKAKEFLSKHNKIFASFNTYKHTNYTILGHCRKASFWADKAKLEQVHPHKADKEGKDFLRLMHNGTITNCENLAKKYELTEKDKSDTMLLTEILTKNWDDKLMNVLREYDGSATLVFYPITTKNTIYVHRDKIRELYYWNETPEKVYFSSMKEALIAIGASEESIIEFEPGKLVKFVGGKVARTWDFTEKKPYFHPKPVTNYRGVNRSGFVQGGGNTHVETPKKDGFYVENAVVKYNGHLYDGKMYVPKDRSQPAVKVLPKELDRPKYDEYHVLCGIIVKDLESYNKLLNVCSKNGVLDPGLFKKLSAGDLQAYAKYPVLGKVFASDDYRIYWSLELAKLTGKDSVYEWEMPLTNTIFKVNRSGVLKDVTPIKVETPKIVNAVDLIDTLTLRAIKEDRHYRTSHQLLADLKGALKDRDYNSEVFVTDFITFLKRNPQFIVRSEVAQLEQVHDNCYGSPSLLSMVDYNVMAKATELLIKYQHILHYAQKPDESIDSNEDAEIQVDTYTETVEDFHDHSDEEFIGSQNFADDIMFGDYETFDHVVNTYAPAGENGTSKLVKAVYVATAGLLKQVGLVAAPTFETIQRGSPASNRTMMNRLFKSFKEDNSLKLVNQIFEEGDVSEGFVKLLEKQKALKKKHDMSLKEEKEYEILKLGIKYIWTTSKTLNKSKLLKEFNVKEESVLTLC